MDRREFFRTGIRKSAEVVYRTASEKAAAQARNWLRPPFATQELDFLLACTRCDKCIEACPHNVLFKLSAKTGLHAAGTPAMDLLNHGCHMCADWPCVQACEPNALNLPEPVDGVAPEPVKLARAQINQNECLPYRGPECGACAHACPVPGALEWRDGIKPVINEDHCTGCALCREACIVDPKAVTISPLVDELERVEA